MSKLLDTLSRWRPFHAIVVGDFMLDEMLFGNVDRLANDAPVPVLHVQRSEHRPGGSANVCLDLVALKGSVLAVGVLGDDLAGDALRVALSEQGVSVDGLVTDGDRPTTVKQNLIGLAQHRHAQKMFRVDKESREPVSERLGRKLIERVAAQIDVTDVILLEDYAKGVLTEQVCRGIIELARAKNVPVLVDPASMRDYSRYRGCTAITPNRNEAEKATGMARADNAPPEAYNELAGRLLDELQLEAAVITLDKHGALLLERDGEARCVPTVARKVYDVTGAGDMVLASLGAARANGLDWTDSVRFANAAAGLEVEQFGVVPIPLEQVHRDLLLRERATRGKLRTLDELKVEVAALRQGSAPGNLTRPTIVMANGCFDVLHAGHVSMLRKAAEQGDFLVVALNSDESVRRLKGPTRPIYCAADRAHLLGELECVGAVVIFEQDTAEDVARAVQPDVLVKGKQYDVDAIPEARVVLAQGGRVELIDVVEGRSTTKTVEKIRAG
jgi:D-beta-D-heptose 7-phosphate kinase/D-beta-D-heptose 1-phosphate adenosyltransferase